MIDWSDASKEIFLSGRMAAGKERCTQRKNVTNLVITRLIALCERIKSVRAGGVGEVWGEVGGAQVLRVIKVLLPLAVIPAQTLIQGGKPIGNLVLSTDGRNRVDGGGHTQTGGGNEMVRNIK